MPASENHKKRFERLSRVSIWVEAGLSALILPIGTMYIFASNDASLNSIIFVILSLLSTSALIFMDVWTRSKILRVYLVTFEMSFSGNPEDAHYSFSLKIYKSSCRIAFGIAYATIIVAFAVLNTRWQMLVLPETYLRLALVWLSNSVVGIVLYSIIVFCFCSYKRGKKMTVDAWNPNTKAVAGHLSIILHITTMWFLYLALGVPAVLFSKFDNSWYFIAYMCVAYIFGVVIFVVGYYNIFVRLLDSKSIILERIGSRISDIGGKYTDDMSIDEAHVARSEIRQLYEIAGALEDAELVPLKRAVSRLVIASVTAPVGPGVSFLLSSGMVFGIKI